MKMIITASTSVSARLNIQSRRLRFLPIDNMDLGIQMQRQISQLPTRSCHQNLNLCFAPAENPREEGVAVRSHGFEHVDLVVAT